MNLEHPDIVKMNKYGTCENYEDFYHIEGDGIMKKFRATMIEEVERVIEIEFFALNEEDARDVIRDGEFEIVDIVQEELTRVEVEDLEEL